MPRWQLNVLLAMRVDIRHLVAKGQNKRLVDSVIAYVATMQQQGKPIDRVIVTMAQHDALMKLARGRGAVLCCGDVLVYFNHGPIDESYHAPPESYLMRDKFSANLPPLSSNPFGIQKIEAPRRDDNPHHGHEWDDDIPF